MADFISNITISPTSSDSFPFIYDRLNLDTNDVIYYRPDTTQSSSWKLNITVKTGGYDTGGYAITVNNHSISSVSVSHETAGITYVDFQIPFDVLLNTVSNIHYVPLYIGKTFNIYEQGATTIIGTASFTGVVYLDFDSQTKTVTFNNDGYVNGTVANGSGDILQKFSYFSDTEYKITNQNTLPQEVNYNLVKGSQDSGYTIDFNLPCPTTENIVGLDLIIYSDTFNTDIFATIVSYDSTNNYGEAHIPPVSDITQTKVLQMFGPYYMLGDSIIDETPCVLQFNIVPNNLENIKFKKDYTIKCVEFIETTDDNILLQKGGRLYCKEFIENQSSYDMFKLSSSCIPSFTFGGITCRAYKTTTATEYNAIIMAYQGGGTASTSSSINIMSTDNQIPTNAESVTVSITTSTTGMNMDAYFSSCSAAYVFRNSNTEEVASFEATSVDNMSHTFTGVAGCYLYMYINVPSGGTVTSGILYPTVTINFKSGISYSKDYSISCNEFVEE